MTNQVVDEVILPVLHAIAFHVNLDNNSQMHGMKKTFIYLTLNSLS